MAGSPYILRYTSFGSGVEAFTTGRDTDTPVHVTVGHQTHGTTIAEVTRPGLTREDLEGVDALVTRLHHCAIGVRTADCIPILLYDPVNRAIAAVHAGWRGTVGKITVKAVQRLTDLYGTQSADLLALIGPGISSRYFQVGDEVVDAFRDNGFPMQRIYEWQGPVTAPLVGGHHLDLPEANRWLLEEAGIPTEQITVSPICTYATPSLCSARREGTRCPRNINAIMLV